MSKLRDISDRILKVKEVAGIEVGINDTGIRSMALCVLQKKGDFIDKKVTIDFSDNISQLKEKIPANIPIVLVLNGKGLIHKKVTHNSNEDISSLFQKTFPNIKSEEFYAQKTEIDETHSLLSIARRDMVDEIIGEIKLANNYIVNVTFGPFSLNYIIPLLSNAVKLNHNIDTGKYAITLKGSKIDSFQPLESSKGIGSVEIGEESIDGSITVAYSAALGYFIDGLKQATASIKAIEMFSEEFRQKKIFLLSGKVALIFFLITLSVNYVVFNNYYNKRNELSAKVSDRLSTIKLYDTLKVQLEKKKEFIGKTSLLAEARTSFYADKLAAEVPSEILLDDLNINPVMKKPESDTTGSLNFTHNVIVISGTSKNSVDVGEWMKLIKMNSWVKDAELLSYNQDKERNEGKFNIKVNIK